MLVEVGGTLKRLEVKRRYQGNPNSLTISKFPTFQLEWLLIVSGRCSLRQFLICIV